jgi:hypothetical protein
MKKCFYFPTWEEREDVMISLDEKTIDIPFAKNGFNLTKDQEFANHIEVELSHSLDYDKVYRGNLQKIGASTRSQSKQEFEEHQNKYPRFTENFDKLYMDSRVEFIEGYRAKNIRFNKSTPSDPILAKLCELTGAKMYGDYVVLSSAIIKNTIETEDECFGEDVTVFGGDIYEDEELTKYLAAKRNNYDFDFNTMCMIDINDNIEINNPGDYAIKYEILYCNIFQEYSKFLSNEENKWEELRVLLSF